MDDLLTFGDTHLLDNSSADHCGVDNDRVIEKELRALYAPNDILGNGDIADYEEAEHPSVILNTYGRGIYNRDNGSGIRVK